MKLTHGGKRKGAGRPPKPEADKLKRVNVMLDDKSIDRAQEIGDGNLSLGIRRAVNR